MRPNHTSPGRPRDRTGASIAGEHHQPLAHSAKTSPSQSLPARAGPVPQSPGTHDPAPESVPPLLSTISRPTQNTRKTPSPESPTRHPPTTHSRGGRGTGPERALQANIIIPSRTARKPPPLRACLRAQARSRRANPRNPTKLSTHCIGTAESLQGALGENQRKRNPSASVPPEMA
jgi:hypothetical protein